MLNFYEMSAEDSKRIIKLVGVKELKKAPKNLIPPKTAMLKLFKTSEISRIDISKFRAYITETINGEEDDIKRLFIVLLAKKLNEEYTYTTPMTHIVNDSKYDELTAEQRELLEGYREAFEAKPLIDDFDNFIRFLCMPSDKSIGEIADNRNVDAMNKLKEDLERLKEEYNQLESKHNELNKLYNRANRELAKAKKANDNLEKCLSVDHISFTLSALLPEGFKVSTVEELYSELDRLEKEVLDSKRFDVLNRILAGKYAVVKIMKEGNE